MSYKLNSEGVMKLITYPKMLIFRALLDSEPIGGIEYSDLLGFMKFHIPKFNDGKLMHHLKIMGKAGLVDVRKERFRNDVRTVISLTQKGREVFREIRRLLKENILGGLDG